MTHSPEIEHSGLERRSLALAAFLGFSLALTYLVMQAPSVRAEPGIDYIQIRSAPQGGGDLIGDRTYWVGDTDVFWAAAYNFTSGYLWDQTVYWMSQNTTVGIVDPSNGNHTVFRAVGEGTTMVHAWFYNQDPSGSTRITNVTGILTVLYRGIDYLQIRDGPHGGGDVVITRNYYVDDTDTFYAAGYNFTDGFVGDLPATWASSNETVCSVVREELAAVFTALHPGVCRVTAEYNATLSNTTDDLIVEVRPLLTVDDSGGADYLTIHEAVENASDGYKIYVYNGTYNEHVVVDKQLIVIGEAEGKTFVDGGDSGIVFLITAEKVEIAQFTIRNAKYGVFMEHINRTKLSNNTITDYQYGIYANRTKDAFVVSNIISHGEYGIVTDHAKNDAIRWNEISYNSVYGAKDYDSTLKNCFNWNYFHHNHVAYYYDPDEPLDPLLFDGNRITDNDVGVLVAYASSVIVTNNTILRNGVGVKLLEASPYVADNIVIGNSIGLQYTDSAARVYRNSIIGGEYGVLGSGLSPTFEDNSILDAEAYEIYVSRASGLRLIENDVGGGVIHIVDSAFDELTLKKSVVHQVNSTVLAWSLDATSVIEVQWYLTVSVSDRSGNPVEDATVSISDSQGTFIQNATTSSDGRAGPFVLTERVKTQAGSETMGQYVVDVSAGGFTARESVLVDENKQLAITLGPIPGVGEGGILWLFLGMVGFAGALTIGGLLSIEVVLYFVLALFVPLYTKLRKDQVLDHYNRGRVYQFIELNPGEHFNAIKKALDLNIGTAAYHLEILQKSGLITSRLDGIYKRFYPTNVPVPPSNGGMVSEVQLRVLHLIKDSPGIMQKELARLLGVRQSTLNYQTSKLEERGLITSERRGRKVHYFAKQPPPPPPSHGM